MQENRKKKVTPRQEFWGWKFQEQGQEEGLLGSLPEAGGGF